MNNVRLPDGNVQDIFLPSEFDGVLAFDAQVVEDDDSWRVTFTGTLDPSLGPVRDGIVLGSLQINRQIFQEMKQPRFCTLAFRIFQAKQAGELVSNGIEQLQDGGDYFSEFDAEGNPLLDNAPQIGWWAEPMGSMYAAEFLLRVVLPRVPWVRSLCGPRKPPEEPRPPRESPALIPIPSAEPLKDVNPVPLAAVGLIGLIIYILALPATAPASFMFSSQQGDPSKT